MTLSAPSSRAKVSHGRPGEKPRDVCGRTRHAEAPGGQSLASCTASPSGRAACACNVAHATPGRQWRIPDTMLLDTRGRPPEPLVAGIDPDLVLRIQYCDHVTRRGDAGTPASRRWLAPASPHRARPRAVPFTNLIITTFKDPARDAKSHSILSARPEYR